MYYAYGSGFSCRRWGTFSSQGHGRWLQQALFCVLGFPLSRIVVRGVAYGRKSAAFGTDGVMSIQINRLLQVSSVAVHVKKYGTKPLESAVSAVSKTLFPSRTRKCDVRDCV